MFQSQSQGLTPFLFPPILPIIPDRDYFINNRGNSYSQPGPPGPQGPAGTPGLIPVTNVTTTPFNVLLGDYLLAVNLAAPSSIVLPIGAPIGTVFIVKDTSGDASTNNITITAPGSTIDGAATYVINIDYASVTLVQTSTEWSVV